MKIAVLVSGGVDSAVALMRLKEKYGAEMRAFFLKIWLEDDARAIGNCPWEEDLKMARAVCRHAGVPIEVIPLQREYYEEVVQYMIRELKMGHTPSPDLFCNDRIKFGAFIDKIGGEFDYIASGHYARLRKRGGHTFLYRGVDPVKDQTYFLSRLHMPQLHKLLFPIGNLQKRAVRRLAHTYRLPNAKRPDSQGLCFLGTIRYPDFVRHYLGVMHGDIVDAATSRTVGTHEGHWFYTIGQRHSLRLGDGPWYVYAKDVEQNIIYVKHGTQSRARNILRVTDLHWINGMPHGQLRSRNLKVKLRHGPHLEPCIVKPCVPDDGTNGVHTDKGKKENGQSGNVLEITLRHADNGIARGQFAVLYHRARCLGVGTII